MHIASVTSRCSRAGAEALRQGAQLAADARDTCRAGALLLRGSPCAIGWVAGWLSAEFPARVVTGHALSRISPRSIGRFGTSWAAQRADQILHAALVDAFGPDFRDLVWHPTGEQSEAARRSGLLNLPHIPGPHRRYAAQTSDIPYGPGGRENLLDIWRRPDLAPGRRAPVLIQVPGGAWTINGKRPQAYPLMSRMVELGWICVSINYSKSPRCTWPAHIVDVKRAIAWVRENIADYGGDPDFITITGGSAGAHLAALAALSANDPALQMNIIGSIAPVLSVLPTAVLEGITGSVIGSDVQASNVPVYPGDTYLAGAKILRQYGIGPLPGVAMMVVLISRGGWCTVTVRYDRASVRNDELFAQCLQAGFDEILALAGDPAPRVLPASFDTQGAGSVPRSVSGS